MGVAGEPINSATDINVIAEAAGSCQSYDPLFEKHRDGGALKRREGEQCETISFFFQRAKKRKSTKQR